METTEEVEVLWKNYINDWIFLHSDHEETSTVFDVTNGDKQGCVLAPTLFSVLLSAMLEEDF